VPSGRPRLRLIKTERGKEPPPRDDVARKAAPRVTHGVWGTQWKVEKEFRDSPGLAFIRRHLSIFDFSELEQIRLRRSPHPYFPWKDSIPIFGKCVTPEETSSGLFRVNCNLLTGVPYPVRLWVAEEPSSGELYLLDDENEAVVAIIAQVVADFLGHTGQILAVDPNEFLRSAVTAYRRSIDKLPGNLAPPGRSGWCVVCGEPLPKGGGSQSFCTGRCRTKWHNSQRRARLAARRGKMACEVCGAQFTPKRRGAKTCSRACRQKKYRKNRTAHNSS
jgi:predicted nucleic acid-binding Zn ribbon protein